MSPSQNKAAMQDHIPQWQASSLSQSEYCKAHDIKSHIFSYYKNKLSSAIPSVKQTSQLVPVKLVVRRQLPCPVGDNYPDTGGYRAFQVIYRWMAMPAIMHWHQMIVFLWAAWHMRAANLMRHLKRSLKRAGKIKWVWPKPPCASLPVCMHLKNNSKT